MNALPPDGVTPAPTPTPIAYPTQAYPQLPPQNHVVVNSHVEPYFDLSTPRNVTALTGKNAFLSCRVRNLGNKSVSETKILYVLRAQCLLIIYASPVMSNLKS